MQLQFHATTLSHYRLGRVLRRCNGPLWNHILFHRGIHGLALRELAPSGIFVKTDRRRAQTFMGVILGSAVVPIALSITWSKANKTGCIVGALAGLAAGIIAWLVTTSARNGGKINVVVRPSRATEPESDSQMLFKD